MQLTDYLALIRERMALVIAVVVATAIASVVVFSLPDPVHEASVRVRARPPAPLSPSNEVVQEEQSDLGTEAELVRSVAVAERVIARLGLDASPSGLLDQVSTGLTPNTSVIIVNAQAGEPAAAVDLANVFAEEYLEFRRASLTASIDAQIARVEEDLAADLSRLAELDQLLREVDDGSTAAVAAELEREQTLAEIVSARESIAALADRQAIQEGFGEIIEPAVQADQVRSTSLPRALVFGILVGVPLALAAVLLFDSLNRSIRSQADAERTTGAPVLGLIPLDPDWTAPRDARLPTREAPLSAVAEAYRTLAHYLSRACTAAEAATVVVTSPGDGEGKSSVAVNAAMALAEAGRHTTLVDGDLRHPRLHQFLEQEREPGLAELATPDAPRPAAVLREVRDDLRFVPAGTEAARPDVVLGRIWDERLTSALTSAEEVRRTRPLRADDASRTSGSIGPSLVLVDSPPLLSSTETSILVSSADATVLVVRAGLTTRASAARAARQIEQGGGRLIGVVVIGGRAADDLFEPETALGRSPGSSSGGMRRPAAGER